MSAIASESVTSAAVRIRRTREEALRAGVLHGRTGQRIALVPTGLDRAAGEALFTIVRTLGARRTFETGCAVAMSTLCIAEALALNCADGCHQPLHVAIDPFQSTNWDHVGTDLVARAGAAQMVKIVEQDSALTLPALVADGHVFDLAYIDGGHFFENAYVDILYALRLVRPRGLIIVDDLTLPAVRAAINFFVQNFGVRPCDTQKMPGALRFAVLEVPSKLPERPDDHFVPFGPEGGCFTFVKG